MDFRTVVERITLELTALGIRHAVCGGLAMQVHGHTRLTKDVDFVVDAARQDEVLGLLRDLGYQPLSVTRAFSNHVHPDPSWGRLDLVWVRETTADLLFSAPRRVEALGGVSVPVLRPEHLVAMKAAAIASPDRREKRLQDKADVAFLLRSSDLDREEIRRYFRRFGVEAELDDIERSLR